MASEHISTGKLGEKIACIYLQQKGYKIITQNFRCKTGEIDIIAKSTKNA
ncbi:MAG: YraN family protein, partial [Patescibacteria group bacterium]